MRVAILSIALVAGGVVVPVAAQAVVESHQVNVPRESLDAALKDLALQTGLQIAHLSDVPHANALVGPVAGQTSALAALNTLLTPLGLTYHVVNGNTIAIVALSSAVAPASEQGQTTVASSAAPGPVTAATQGASPTGGQETSQLQEVVVTAERRVQDIQQVPAVITAISGDQLEEQHLLTLSDLQGTVPTFSGGLGTNHVSLSIRGIGDLGGTNTVTTGVAVFRDGVLMSEITGLDNEMYDIADVEVLEGPQGTFVGSSSTAGAVQINSANPNFRGVNGYAEAQLGNYSDTKLDGAVNLPVNDTFAARVAFNTEQRGSFYHDVGSTQFNGDNTQSVTTPDSLLSREMRVGLLWKPTDNFQALGKVEYNYLSTNGDDYEPNPKPYQSLFSNGNSNAESLCTVSGQQLICPVPGTVAHSPYDYPGETPFVLKNGPIPSTYFDTIDQYSLELRYTEPNGVVLRSMSGLIVTNYQANDPGYQGPFYTGSSYSQYGPFDDYYSQEFNIISPTTGPFFSKFNWIAGTYYYYRVTPVWINGYSVPAPYTYNLNPTQVNVDGRTSVNRMIAVFGQANWQMTSTLQLQIGFRENWDNNSQAGPTPGPVSEDGVPGAFSCCNPSTPNGIYAISYVNNAPVYTLRTANYIWGDFKDSIPTGKVDLSWTPVAGQNFYAFYARGYKPGGPNQSGSTETPYFQPEYVNDWEAGWKGRLFDGHLLTQVGAYYMNYQNMQYSIYDTSEENDTVAGGGTVGNLAASTIKGLELGLQGQFGGLGVNFTGDYNDSSLGNILTLNSLLLPPGFNSPVSHPQCEAGRGYPPGVTCFDYTPYLTNVSGEATPYAPKFTANFSVQYTFMIGSDSLIPRVIYSYSSQQYSSIFETAYYALGVQHRLNANLDFDAGPWDVQVYATNLTNQLYLTGASGTVVYGDPRQYGIRVHRDF